MEQLEVAICQSCGMPLEKEENFGSNADESKNLDYCNFCFTSGKFTEPDIVMEQMIEKVSFIKSSILNMPKDSAREISIGFIPELKRWKN